MKRIILSLGIFVVILFFLSRAIKLQVLLDSLFLFPKIPLLFLCLLSIGISLLKAWRFQLLLHTNNIPINFWQTCKVYLAGQVTTPLPGGEAFRAVLLKNEVGAKIKDTSGAVVTQAFLEFISAAVLAVAGSFHFKLFRGSAVATAFLLVFMLVILLNESILSHIVSWLSKMKKLQRLGRNLLAMQKDIQRNILGDNTWVPSQVFLKVLIIAVIAHLLGGIMIYIIAVNYHLRLNIFQSIFVYTSGIVITAIAGVVPGGLGFIEGGMVGLFVLLGIAFSNAITVVIMFRLITLVFYMLIGLVVYLVFYRNIFVRKVKK